MAAWFDPLVALRAGQPPDTATVTLMLTELEMLASRPLPVAAATQTYWYAGASAPSRRLAAIGWRMDRLNRSSWTLTFARTGPVLTVPGGEVM